MKSLIDRIKKDAVCLSGGIIKVDSFINHQMDTALVDDIGREFADLFRDAKIDKILTIEASGIGFGVTTGIHLGKIPVVFAKKSLPNTMTDKYYSAEIKSFTKGTSSLGIVTKKYLNKGEHILIIDDFLAHGEASMGLIKIAEQAGCHVVGVGAVVEKVFQGGGNKIRERGYRVASLAMVEKVNDDGSLVFANE